MSHEIVKYRNDFNAISFNNFNLAQSGIFFGILSRLRDKGTKTVTLSFKHIARLSGIKYGRRKGLFYRDLKSTYHKILGLTIYQNNKHKYTEITLFSKFTIDKDNKKVIIVINPYFSGLLNHLAKQFTRFSLRQYTILRSRYARRLFRRIMTFRSTGKLILPMAKFKRVMGVPKSYGGSMITRKVLNPCKIQLTPFVRDLHVVKQKAHGNHIVGYVVKFKPVNTEYDKLVGLHKTKIGTYNWMLQNIKMSHWLTARQKVKSREGLDKAFNVRPTSLGIPMPKHKKRKKKKYEPMGAFNRTLEHAKYSELKYLYSLRNTPLTHFSPYQKRKLRKRIHTIKAKAEKITYSIYGTHHKKS